MPDRAGRHVRPHAFGRVRDVEEVRVGPLQQAQHGGVGVVAGEGAS
ncbi:hypothetical protein ACFFSW_01815 [Saccharothrix longispora]|uniref:Uncharacterized protein n=1 Tax=Saccharothrix longispora TaxID=33920 RepID=A0ABU1PVR2_9PSEU|nr:hypothetical protein [Saccharothrix longispora]MDR6594720.1 hypothetical protein [Saccharothrix longispora]